MIVKKCKYVLISGFLLKDIVNGKYPNIYFVKVARSGRWNMYSNNNLIGAFLDKRTVDFMNELLYQLSFLPKEK